MALTSAQKAMVQDIVGATELPDRLLDQIYNRFREHFAKPVGWQFTATETETALGTAFTFSGPGIVDSARVHFVQGDDIRTRYEVANVQAMLGQAYEAGVQDAKKELCDWLGVK